MEISIRLVVVVIVLIVVAIVVISLLGAFSGSSYNILEGIFGFFNSLFGGQTPEMPT